jgi:hypothetical protein
MTQQTTNQTTKQAQLTERVTSYDPEKEVAVLFAYRGQVRD